MSFDQGCHADLSIHFTPYEGVYGTIRLSRKDKVLFFGVYARSVEYDIEILELRK